jgi:hypothetical protein
MFGGRPCGGDPLRIVTGNWDDSQSAKETQVWEGPQNASTRIHLDRRERMFEFGADLDPNRGVGWAGASALAQDMDERPNGA